MYSHTNKVIQSPTFKGLPDKLMIKFCQSSDLYVKELNLFLAVVEWYQHQKKDITDDTIKNILFQQICYPLISVSDLLEKVCPTKCADSVLYTSALEFHHMPSKYQEPKIQLVNRKFILDFVKYTTNTMTIDEYAASISNTKTGSNNWDGLCAAQVYPTEQCRSLCILSFH